LRTRVSIKGNCGCGLILTGSAKDVITKMKDHSAETGHGCEIHGIVRTEVIGIKPYTPYRNLRKEIER
jgi:hypothetical protein